MENNEHGTPAFEPFLEFSEKQQCNLQNDWNFTTHYAIYFYLISHKPEFISNIPEKSWEIRVTKKPNKS